MNQTEKPKNSVEPSLDDKFPVSMFYWRLFVALIIPATLLAALLMLPVILINTMAK